MKNTHKQGIKNGRGMRIGDVKDLLVKSYQPTLSSHNDFEIDNSLSDRRVQVYKHKHTKQAVVVHRGTNDFNDVITDARYAIGKKDDARFQHSIDTQKKAHEKYGAENTTTLGHSLGKMLGAEAGKDSKEIITYNGGYNLTDAINPHNKNEYSIRTSGDPVSILGSQKANITIPSNHRPFWRFGSLSHFKEMLDAHGLSHLDKLNQDEIIGNGVKGTVKSRNKPHNVVGEENKILWIGDNP